MLKKKQKLTTPELFATYLDQLEELGVSEFYWNLPDSNPLSSDTTTTEVRLKRLTKVQDNVSKCTKCGLHEGRTQTVFGVGNPNADLVIVGEAPGFEEDRQGIPFVGKAGQLLTKILKAMHLSRDEVYICNIIKCRPPKNRDPNPEEIITCESYLVEQLKLLEPKVICAMGRIAAQALLQTKTSISKLRGKWYNYKGTPVMPTFHPAYLLRNPSDKRLVWDDMQQVIAYLST